MRRDQNNSGSQIIRNLAYNPSFESTNVSTIIRSNYATNPSLETAGASTAVRTNLLTNPSAETASGTVNVRTNLALNPSFEGTSGTTNVRTNLVVNPSMETGFSAVTTRTNLCLNPSFETGVAYWNAVAPATIVQDTSVSYIGAASMRVSSTAAGQSIYMTPPTKTFATGEPYCGSLAFKGTSGVTYTITIAHTGAGTYPVSTVTATGSWQKVSVNGGIVASTASSDPYLVIASNATGSDTYWVDTALVEKASSVGNYFDGTIAASENLVKGVPATMLSLTTAITGVSYSGQTWVRATVPSGPSANAGIVRQFVNLSDLQNGETYTTSVTVANDQSFSQSVSLDWCDLNYLYVTLAPGEIRRLVVTATKSSYDSTFRFSDLQPSQSPTESRSILFKDWLIEKGTTTGEYYTGTGDFTYTWSGTANASTGLQRASGVTNWGNASLAASFQSTTQKNISGKSLGIVTRGANGDGVSSADITAIAGGASYTFSAWVKQTTAHPLTFGFRWKDSSQVILSDSLITVAPTVGQWTRVTATATAPTGSVAYLQPMIRIYAAHTATVLYIDDVLIERASGLGSYFDGTTAASGDFTYVWSGTAHGSWSYQQAPTVATWLNRWFGNGGGYGSFYQAKGGLSGNYARKIWTSANTGATMDAGINLPPVGVATNTPYTFSVWVRCSVTQYMNPYIDWRDSANNTISATQMTTGTSIPANTWTRISVTGTSPSTAVSAYFVAGPYAQALPMPYGTTLDFDNALIEATSFVQDYFDGANPIQNLITNPSFEVDTSGWLAQSLAAGSGRSTSRSYSGVGSYYMIATDNLGDSMAIPSTSIPVTPYATYTVSACAYIPAGVVASDFRGGNRNLWAVSYDGVSQSTVASANLDFTKTNQWQRISQTINIPAITTGLSIRLYAPANPLGIYWDAVMVEKTNTLNPYYEGQGDYSYGWAVAANTSVSYQQAPGVSGVTSPSYLSQAYQSKTVGISSGTKSIRITPTNVNNGDSFAELNGMLGGYTFKPNTTYTISGNRTMIAPQTNMGGTTHFRVNIGGTELSCNVLASVVNVAGTQRITARFTTGAATGLGFVRVYNGSYFGGGDVWWDDIILEEGTTDGVYFDGTNQLQNLISNSSFDTDTSGWGANTGTPTLSSDSTMTWFGSKSLKAVSTIASADIAVTTNVTLAPNTTYTVSWYVYSSAARTAYFDVAGTGFQVSSVGTKAIPANTWTRVSGTFTTNAYATGLQAIYFHHGGGPATVGQIINIDAVLVERSAYLHPYYAGLGDFTYAWTGTANGSTSEQRANLVADRQSVATSSTTYQSSVRALSGSKSGCIRVKNDVFASGTLMYPVNEYFTTTSLAVSAYNTWSLWVWVPSGSGTVRLEDVTTGTIGAANTTFDTWERISVTFMGGAANSAHILRFRAATTITAGTVIWWDSELIEQSPAVLSYFDGSSGITGDFTHSWAGIANASVSRESALGVDGYSPYAGNSVVSSTDWASSGTRSLRVSPVSSNPDSFAYMSSSVASVFETGKTYTISANIRLTAPQTGTLDSRARKILVYHSNGFSSSNQAPNAVGVSRVSVTFKVTDATQYQNIRLYNGASAGGGDVWWDDIMVVEGTYTGDYVDGTKPFSKWEGVAQKSVSIGYPPQLLDIAGMPAMDWSTVGVSSSPVVDPYAARTLYFVYEAYNQSTSYASYGSYGIANSNGFNLQTSLANSTSMAVRLDFPSGSVNASLGGLSGTNMRSVRRHVTSFAFAQGLASVKYSGNALPEFSGTLTPGNGWTSGRVTLNSDASGTGLRVLVYYAEHDLATRTAISRYLGNKYGASVA